MLRRRCTGEESSAGESSDGGAAGEVEGDDGAGLLQGASLMGINLDEAFLLAVQRRRGLDLFQQELALEDDSPDGGVDLLRASLAVATHAYPELDIDEQVGRVEALAASLLESMPAEEERYPLRVLKALSQHFGELGFEGAQGEQYSTVDSMCVNRVLDNRRGIPITLSLLWMAVAKRAGLRLVPVYLPAHLMVRPDCEGMEVLVDPYGGGEVMFVEDAEERLAGFFNASGVKIDRLFLEDATVKPRTFLTRLLTNLKQVYYNKGEYDNALLMAEFQAMCAPSNQIALLNSRDQGICYYLLGRYAEAVEQLEGYLGGHEEGSPAQDESQVRTIIARARAGQGPPGRPGDGGAPLSGL